MCKMHTTLSSPRLFFLLMPTTFVPLPVSLVSVAVPRGSHPPRHVDHHRPWLRPSCHGSSTCRWHPLTCQSLPLAWAPSATTGERAPADASVVAAGLGSIRRAMGVPPTVGLGLSCHPGPVLEGGERGGRPRPPNQEGPFTGIYKQYSIQNIRAQV
jgi:hypothetical protein